MMPAFDLLAPEPSSTWLLATGAVIAVAALVIGFAVALFLPAFVRETWTWIHAALTPDPIVESCRPPARPLELVPPRPARVRQNAAMNTRADVQAGSGGGVVVYLTTFRKGVH